MDLEIIDSHRAFGGDVLFCRHTSRVCDSAMRFSVYLPGGMEEPPPLLYWLSGLTCTEENFMVKAGAQQYAARSGLAIVCPDTSPRQTGIPGEDDDWDLGTGAGFYVDATAAPWSAHYRMQSWVTGELRELIATSFPVDGDRAGIFGHSMGGHGALVCALRNPGLYRSVSAFAPICSPTRCPWGHKALGAYLGDDQEDWQAYDACRLMARAPTGFELLVDQGMADTFLDEQLRPDLLEQACRDADVSLTLNRRQGYDHSYYFIASFVGGHIDWHAERLRSA